MDGIRVSASDIDAFRRYRDDEEADLGAFLAQMRRETPPTEAMLAGTALHKALEFAEPGQFGELVADGYTFTFDTDAVVDIPVIREMKATREYVVSACVVTLVGKVDAIHGKRVDDHKFTSRYDAERFLDSYQWRIYLDVFGADEFRWNVFEGREVGPQTYVITAVHPLRMHRYPRLRDDIELALMEFVEFARQFLPERITETDPPLGRYLLAG